MVLQFKYIVEIEGNDPDLYLDEMDYVFRQEYNEAFGNIDNEKWFFLKKSINVSDTLEWDGQRYFRRVNL